ncbi:carboxylesterase family protein [Salinibacterium hongtaonis]|uniref:Carboxylesterase n=1 Tax=Homoserinimonas hongtaonis TaxID=2079791 RepID=A0A2U1T3T3_9MICO|nr:carboxylesterase family protein [Salinibacterium hongtaonis]PWB98529.1 carboxylesterase [Salinibacterium hongtaonis]
MSMPSLAQPTFAPPCGPVVGWVDVDVARATGIPYAHADRFEAPVAATDWTEPHDATTWSPSCPQQPVPFLAEVLGSTAATIPPNEHCQNLSVTMPLDLAPDERVPVMVWIHGGSYSSGAGDVPIMDPRALVRDHRVVVVTVTYRLATFGFVGGIDGRPANLGLLDQIEAFRWVKRNIAAFGGDPERVTAFGQSAGADAIAHIMATPDAASLFSRAIIQSPPLGLARGRAKMAAAMAEATSSFTPEMTAADIVAKQPDIVAAGTGFGLVSSMPYGIQYGHDPLPSEEGVNDAWSAVANDIDVLIGSTAEEARLFTPRLEGLQKWISLRGVGPAIHRLVVSALTKSMYTRAISDFAKRYALAGGTIHSYAISWSAPGNQYGSAHTIDLPLLFGDEQSWKAATLLTGATWPEIDAHARTVRALWSSFAHGERLPDSGSIPGVLTYRKA